MKDWNPITVFEHETLHTDRGKKRLSLPELEALELFYGEKGVDYFTLIHRGIKFKEFVGVLQVGNTTIEVLPKADKRGNTTDWRSVLIGMLGAVGGFKIHAPSSSSLQVKRNAILDLYFELFISEVEYLVHQGLVKRYLKQEGNKTALKGNLHFPKHLQQNLIHQERFFVRHTTYNTPHLLNSILYKGLQLLKRINNNPMLQSRIGALLLYYPEQPDIKVSETLFRKVQYTRKTESYRKAIEIAQLLLLNYHPDVRQGQHHVLAIMFNMNLLWEKFVYASLRKYKPAGTTILSQSTKSFWQSERGNASTLRPDIVVNPDHDNCLVLDTKWKHLSGKNPSSQDLRQMYVYNQYYGAKKSALVYPGLAGDPVNGQYFHESSQECTGTICSVIPVSVNDDIACWQKDIYEKIAAWGRL